MPRLSCRGRSSVICSPDKSTTRLVLKCLAKQKVFCTTVQKARDVDSLNKDAFPDVYQKVSRTGRMEKKKK